ncbi:MAG: SH3 domain-containing protein [Lachnospiraceae bacterium]|nr:SH3 domain-containing protein [Lachnospiraceae bacterium]
MKKIMAVRKKTAYMVLALTLAFSLGMSVPTQTLAAPPAGASAQMIQMPGYVLEQWSAPKLMLVAKNYNVRVQPNTSAQKLGQLQKDTFVNAWGQTDTGWYFVEFAGTVAYVRYEAAVPLELMDAQTQAAALAAYQQQTGQAAAVQAAQTAAAAQTQTAAPAVAKQTAAAAAAQVQPAQTAAVVFIGDSRMVGMERDLIEAVGHCPVTVVAQNGARHEWLESNGIPRADKVIGKGTKVLINMGVNDLGHVKDYLPLVNAFAAAWTARGAQVYYASVNPVFANPYNMTEERVTVFNRELRAGLIPQITWIDSNTYLKQTGIKCNDGIHYLPVTNLVLYQYYMAMMGIN